MDKNLIAARDSMVEGLGQLTEFFGLSRVMGRLFGALLMSPTPLSLDELQDILDISKASVSMNMRALERWNMVREVWVRGDRRKFYEAEPDLWKVVASILESRERKEVGKALSILEDQGKKLREVEPNLSDEDRILAEHYLQRMEDLQAFFQFAQMGLELFLNRGAPQAFNQIASSYGNSDANAAATERRPR